MPDAYSQLLDATIQHLEALKARGVNFISVSPQSLAGLTQPSATKARSTDRRDVAASPPGATRPPFRSTTAVARPEVSNPAVTNPPPTLASATSPVPGISPAAKLEAFSKLRERALACTRCPNLVAARKTVVFGVGDINAQLMFVGEAPGADEDEQGEPFVGKAGQLLTKIIQTTGLARDAVYIANILKCRPDTPGQASGNRKPTGDEMQTCIPFLHEQIDLILPRVIVALGGTAIEGLLGKTVGIMRLRGHWQEYRGIPLMPTYHPAYLLRNQALSEKRRVWEDMLQVMERLSMPISDKQRNYFL
jgi:DNA polymerase